MSAVDHIEDLAPEVVPTGIVGLDQILGGGLPRGRVILTVGAAGSGKTLLATEFLVRGASEHDEPGVLLSFEETADDLVANAAGLGWNLRMLETDGMMKLMPIDLSGVPGSETGGFDLSALFMRIELAIDAVGARRIVLDGLSNLMAAFTDERTVRQELLKLFRWLKERDLAIIATGERGVDTWTRSGFEDYLADGLIVLDNRVGGKSSKRLLRVVKCRGINHGTDEYPFLIGLHGFQLFPVVAAQLDHGVSSKRVPTGVTGLDEMFGGQGFYKGTTILIGGSAGTGKSSLACSFAEAACARGERALVCSFEESPAQLCRNMSRIGIDLAHRLAEGSLHIRSMRPNEHGLEGHLMEIQAQVDSLDPGVVVIDPISALTAVGDRAELNSMMIRLVDFLRARGITNMLTNLASSGRTGEMAEVAISSMADTWIVVRTIEDNAERNNVVQVIKSRGMSHSSELREFNFTSRGIEIVPAYIGLDGVVIGSARVAREHKDKLAALERKADLERRERELEERRKAVDAQIAQIQADYAADAEALVADREAFRRTTELLDSAARQIKNERQM